MVDAQNTLVHQPFRDYANTAYYICWLGVPCLMLQSLICGPVNLLSHNSQTILTTVSQNSYSPSLNSYTISFIFTISNGRYIQIGLQALLGWTMHLKWTYKIYSFTVVSYIKLNIEQIIHKCRNSRISHIPIETINTMLWLFNNNKRFGHGLEAA